MKSWVLKPDYFMFNWVFGEIIILRGISSNSIQFQRSRWIYLLIGCFIGLSIPFLLDSLAAYRDQFGMVRLQWGERVTLMSVSPNDSVRVLLVDRGFFDRNFKLRIQEKGSSFKTIFLSPDEEKPAGSERILWSSDSSQFVLVCNHSLPPTQKLTKARGYRERDKSQAFLTVEQP